MKFAVVSTPRSGNTWLRYMLASLYGLKQHAAHTPQGLDWAALSDDCIVQLHWHCEPAFSALLADNNFRVVTIARHPISVLLSIWQFAAHEPETARWLDGEGGNEAAILNRPVASPEFLSYACGPRARALLSVSAEWWHAPGSLKVRYEDLVQSPDETLARLCQPLGPTCRSIAATLQDNTLEKLRTTSTNNHFWKGQPDAWRQMIPPDFVREIEHAHSDIFKSLNYAREA